MADQRIADWVRPAVQQLSAYHVADANGMIKLDAMENPYELPAELAQGWLAVMQSAALNRYPDPGAEALKLALRQSSDIPADAQLILGNGSDEIIQMLALALGGAAGGFLSPEPGFVMYRLIAAMNGLPYTGVALNSEDFSLDLPATVQAIHDQQPAVVFIANPNNPTGNIHSLQQLREIAAVCPGLLVIDEAYAPFTDMSAAALVSEYDHVLVMRTVSKMGLAGLRLGYLFGNPAWLEQLEKVRLPYNINVLTQLSASFALEHHSVFDQQAGLIRQSRTALYQQLSAMSELTVWPSEANFILFRAQSCAATAVFTALKDEGILIKLLDGAHPLLEDCLRVTVGTQEENQRFVEALTSILQP